MSTSAKSPLGPIRRVVTGTTPEGKSAFVTVAPIEPLAWRSTGALFAPLFRADEHPAVNAVEFRDLATEQKESSSFSQTGSVLWTIEMPPRHSMVCVSLH